MRVRLLQDYNLKKAGWHTAGIKKHRRSGVFRLNSPFKGKLALSD